VKLNSTDIFTNKTRNGSTVIIISGDSGIPPHTDHQ